MFITKKVFDPSLAGKAVHIKGNDVEGDPFDRVFLIKSVDGENLKIINSHGREIDLHMGNFEHEEGLKLQILELPKPEKLPFDDIEPETLPLIRIDKPQRATGFTRNQGAKNVRSDLQVKVDNAHLEFILQDSFMPLKLEEIVRRMRKNHGHEHWNAKNASGFVLHAMKMGKRIKKVGRGFYSFDREAQK